MKAIKNQIASFFAGKRIAILGFGKESKSSLALIRSFHPKLKVEVYDEKTAPEKKAIKDRYTTFVYSSKFKKVLFEEYDLVLKSPGIPFFKLPKSLVNSNVLFGQTELFLKWYGYCTIGVTGTKGKSTTSSLIFHLLKQAKYKVLLGGNIGVPLFDLIPKISAKHYVVAEMSCHQLNKIEQSPHIGVLLNLFEEHLDYYKTVDAYFESKLPIFKNQTSQDYLIYNHDSAVLKRYLKESKQDHATISYSTKSEKAGYWIKKDVLHSNQGRWSPFGVKTRLLGKVNQLNILPAVAVASLLKLKKQDLIDGLASFQPLAHRLQYLGKANNIHFVNDSISTIPEATIAAVKALQNVGCLFLGGKDRGIDYNDLVEFVIKKKIKSIVFFDKAGTRMYKAFKKENEKQLAKTKHIRTNDFVEAIQFCLDNTKAESYCLLSPAASSYGLFKNFEDRGQQFAQLVLSLSKHKRFSK